MMSLEWRIKIGEWCGWLKPYKSYLTDEPQNEIFINGKEVYNRTKLFTQASHFEALRQVLREKGYNHGMAFCHSDNSDRNNYYNVSILPRNNTWINVDVINGDEHTAWLEAVKQLIEKESHNEPAK